MAGAPGGGAGAFACVGALGGLLVLPLGASLCGCSGLVSACLAGARWPLVVVWAVQGGRAGPEWRCLQVLVFILLQGGLQVCFHLVAGGAGWLGCAQYFMYFVVA